LVPAQPVAPAEETVITSRPADPAIALPVAPVGQGPVSSLRERRRVRRLGSRPEYGRMLRGAMLTPWFAVSIGIVIATSLTLATPHPALTFPAPKSGRCVTAGCGSRSATPAPPAPAIKHEVRLPSPASDANVRAAGIKVEYQLLPKRHHDGFMAVIVVQARHRLGTWQLQFSLPGATIQHIMWGKWRHDGQNGVVVSGSPLPWPKSGDNEARIVVFGTGTPRWPARCQFDGGPCTFRALIDHASHTSNVIHVGG
jgi:hypothetical protein